MGLRSRRYLLGEKELISIRVRRAEHDISYEIVINSSTFECEQEGGHEDVINQWLA